MNRRQRKKLVKRADMHVALRNAIAAAHRVKWDEVHSAARRVTESLMRLRPVAWPSPNASTTPASATQ